MKKFIYLLPLLFALWIAAPEASAQSSNSVKGQKAMNKKQKKKRKDYQKSKKENAKRKAEDKKDKQKDKARRASYPNAGNTDNRKKGR